MQTKIDVKPNPVQMLVGQFIEYCEVSRGMSLSTIRTRKTHLSQFSQYCFENAVFDVSQLTPAFIDDYFSFYQTTHSKNTANTGRRILKSFLHWLEGYKELRLSVRPEQIKLVRTPRTLPKSIDGSVIISAIKTSQNAQDGLIIAILAQSGVRISELTGIRVEDVKFDTIVIHGKGSIERTVYISTPLALELEAFIKNNRLQPYDYLFTNTHWHNGSRLTTKTARLRIQRCFENVGVKMHPHQLRHSFAISLLENGCDIVTIQRLLGHADIQTTMVYLRVTDTFLKNSYKKYTNFA